MDFQQLAFGLLLAKREKDKLKELGADVPSNFNTKQGILFGAFQNSLLPTVLLQNESKKLIPDASKDAQSKLAAKDQQIEQANDVIASRNEDLQNITKDHRDLNFKLLRFIEDVENQAVFTKDQLLALIPEHYRTQGLEIPEDITLLEDQKPVPFESDLNTLDGMSQKIEQVLFTNGIISVATLRIHSADQITNLLSNNLIARDMPVEDVINAWVVVS